jgi:hypothetical protein
MDDIDDMDDTDFMDTDDMQESDFEEIEYIRDNLSEAEVAKIQEYLQQLDSPIPTEEHLSDEQIINLIQFEETENKDEDTSDEEIPLVAAKQAVNGLETFIKYFEQQNDNSKFNTNELHIFRKYLHTTKVIAIDSKKQCTLDNYFGN